MASLVGGQERLEDEDGEKRRQGKSPEAFLLRFVAKQKAALPAFGGGGPSLRLGIRLPAKRETREPKTARKRHVKVRARDRPRLDHMLVSFPNDPNARNTPRTPPQTQPIISYWSIPRARSTLGPLATLSTSTYKKDTMFRMQSSKSSTLEPLFVRVLCFSQRSGHAITRFYEPRTTAGADPGSMKMGPKLPVEESSSTIDPLPC